MVRATAKYIRVSPRKARLVADLVRGKSVPEARAILAFATRDAAVPVGKVLNSAAANADNNHGLRSDELVLAHVTVDPGPTIKRFRPRAKGSASPIMKRTCHITIGLAQPAERSRKRGN
ncbi:MAG TPA: 50S ribosomal protein L22 [Miltoncostaeales bacterium]|nr:50S ribosomal protein L22 [Miltoncostaeales bacterium]